MLIEIEYYCTSMAVIEGLEPLDLLLLQEDLAIVAAVKKLGWIKRHNWRVYVMQVRDIPGAAGVAVRIEILVINERNREIADGLIVMRSTSASVEVKLWNETDRAKGLSKYVKGKFRSTWEGTRSEGGEVEGVGKPWEITFE